MPAQCRPLHNQRPEVGMNILPIAARRAAFALALLSATLVLGCHRGGDPTGELSASSYDNVVRLTIQNNDFKDCTIYANWAGHGRRRVGMVVGKTSETFTFEWVSDYVTFEGDFIAGEPFVADPINVQGGDHLDLVIMNQG